MPTVSTLLVKLETTLQFYDNTASAYTQKVLSNEKEVSFTSSQGGGEPKITLGERARKRKKERSYHLEGTEEMQASVLAPFFIGDRTRDEERIVTNTYKMAFVAIVRSMPLADHVLWRKWFGKPYTRKPFNQEYNLVETVYAKMGKFMREEKIFFRLHATIDVKNVVAFTTLGSDEIYLCDEYFNAPQIGTDSMMGIIIHEMSHAVAYTEDVSIEGVEQYGKDCCKKLAKKHPELARNNADNFEYFSEDLFSKKYAK